MALMITIQLCIVTILIVLFTKKETDEIKYEIDMIMLKLEEIENGNNKNSD